MCLWRACVGLLSVACVLITASCFVAVGVSVFYQGRRGTLVRSRSGYGIIFLAGCGSGDVRVVNGFLPSEGRVEVCQNDSWIPVCDEGWGNNDARVVCRQLGFAEEGEWEGEEAKYRSRRCTMTGTGCYVLVHSIIQDHQDHLTQYLEAAVEVSTLLMSGVWEVKQDWWTVSW